MSQERIPHKVVWNSQKIADYWNIWGNLKPKSPWFGEKASGWILGEIKKLRAGGYLKVEKPRVLDTGCGSGYLLSIFAKAGFECFGIDLSPERVERAQKEYPRMIFKVGSTMRADFSDNYFDLVVSTQTVEHLLDEDVKPSFNEMARLVRPGGLVIMTTRYDEDLTQGYHACPDCHAVYRYSQHLQSYDIPKMEQLFRDAGLEQVVVKRSRCRNHLRDLLPQHYIGIFRAIDPLLYRLFGSKLDKKIGKYLYGVASKPQ
ncbi:MAG: class I SAM-dependent methyltransferase [bacterium]|nr:class I SAM-dependent methyltransferase [bacterium]